MEGAAGSVGEAVGRADAGEAIRGLDATGAEAVVGREGEAEADGRAPDEGETPLRSSSIGIRRWA